MKIYTRTGDEGKSSLFRGERVWKDNLLLASYGTVDELNSLIGLIRCASLPDPLEAHFESLQNELFALGSDLATPYPDVQTAQIRRFAEEDVTMIEHWIDRLEQHLPPLANFILPGGTELSAHLHQARTVSRRAEREATGALREGNINPFAYRFLNRLSDYFFVAARYANLKAGHKDVIWDSKMNPTDEGAG
jgi:cob(I)alamin adenosyltransferase